MLKEVPINQLRPGMRIVDTGMDWTERPFLYAKEGIIESDEQISQLIEAGYRSAFTKGGGTSDVVKNDDTPPQTIQAAQPKKKIQQLKNTKHGRGASLAEEIVNAREIHSQMRSFAKHFMQEARLGKKVSYNAAAPLVEDLVDSVTRNEDALMAMKFLKSFDEYTFNHSINVAVLTSVFALELGYTKQRNLEITQAAVFHDIGKAFVPEEVLNKPERLTEEEFMIMKDHPVKSYELLREVRGPSRDALAGVLEHHEKNDGSGYPDGLKGDEINEFGKVIAVADVYDALTSERVYKSGLPPSKALNIMYGMRQTAFAPGYVEQFIKHLGIYPLGSFVRLTSGEAGVVVQGNPQAPMYPTVRLFLDREMHVKKVRDVDLERLHSKTDDAPSILQALDAGRLGVDVSPYLT